MASDGTQGLVRTSPDKDVCGRIGGVTDRGTKRQKERIASQHIATDQWNTERGINAVLIEEKRWRFREPHKRAITISGSPSLRKGAKMKVRTKDKQALWDRYWQARTDANRNALVEAYADLVNMQAARLARKLPARISFDEICSAGYDGLLEAVQSFEPARQVKFETYCQQRILGAILDWLRTLDPQSRTVRRFEKQCMRTQETLETELGWPASQDEIAQQMGMSMGRYTQLMQRSRAGHHVHFSNMEARTMNSNERSEERIWDVGDPKQPNPAEPVTRSMLADFLTRGLTHDERMVIVLYYYETLTMAEIGRTLQLSESRVSQIHKDVIARFKARYRTMLAEELLVA